MSLKKVFLLIFCNRLLNTLYRLNVFKNSDATPPPKTRQFLDEQLVWARSHSEDQWRALEEQRLDAGEEEMSNDEKYWRTVHVVIVCDVVRRSICISKRNGNYERDK